MLTGLMTNHQTTTHARTASRAGTDAYRQALHAWSWPRLDAWFYGASVRANVFAQLTEES